LDIRFGSSGTSGASWGDDDEDYEVDEDYEQAEAIGSEERNENTRKDLLDPKARMNRKQKEHEKRVEEILRADDEAYKVMRKQKKWGAFANVTNPKELQLVMKQQQLQTEKDNRAKMRLAESLGVQFTVLSGPAPPTSGAKYRDETGTLALQAGGTVSSSSWFAEMDQELAEEWKELTMNDDISEISDGGDESAVDSPLEGPGSALETRDGKLVPRDAVSGVRVGSAGGWTLEVFPGDFVVHRKYGIGRFERTCLRPKTRLSPEEQRARDERRGEILTKELRRRKSVTPEEIQEIRSKFGTEEDNDPVSNPQVTVLEISYADAVVHVPVDRAYRLSRYRDGNSIVKPRLSRVKGQAWVKAKQRVQENTIEIAQDVLALYATREMLQRPPCDPSHETAVREFEATFLFEPTQDQQRCFDDVENDMVWRQRPMDRLVCGDVGFGKTEVAMRAMYRAVANGRQAALLAPTGVLAAQHYKNVVKRMAPFGIRVALLRGGNGGQKSRLVRTIRDEIASGEAHVVIGTHSLLSNGVTYKDLGLLVVDEEQRFGVKQKERLKLICKGIDVLTLSATPIPRTLQMSLSGIRDTSTIRSPPPMRKPTITYVQDYSPAIVERAIRTELERGGQCYYVVPRISMLQTAEDRIREIFPGVRVIQAHGRMHRNGAEENVAEFAEGKYDILLATTVIENGVDIPSVNTIIVDGADFFGMSSLYQLRGRVGRSDQQAYAYFLHGGESITEQAIMRLQAIGELNELGSGFDIANRDLEIRGAGSLLGTEQSGLAARVGFDLYMRMLKKSIRKLRGLDLPLVPRTNVLILPNGCGKLSIPEAYITNTNERQMEEGKARLAESTAALVKLTNDWKDRFGPLPTELQIQLKTMHLYACTRRLGIDLVGLVCKSESGKADCVLRSPGLRPRHWAMVAPLLPLGAVHQSVSICFPSRFMHNREDTELRGGQGARDDEGVIGVTDLKSLLTDESLSEDSDDEEWDSMDQEELEAMKEISSAIHVKSVDDVDWEQYPRIVIRDFSPVVDATVSSSANAKSVDKLLKVLLPIAKVVTEVQTRQADEARVAADLRQKQELLRTRKRQNEAMESQRMGLSMYGDLL
jgi:transcription-repair coupling factor (superfamily II helicase)